jgi:hypothetical protein
LGETRYFSLASSRSCSSWATNTSRSGVIETLEEELPIE